MKMKEKALFSFLDPDTKCGLQGVEKNEQSREAKRGDRERLGAS
jgi:hypothetical protein